jgi:hypothetical protein
MKIKLHIIICSTVALALAGLCGGCASQKESQAELMSQAKISKADAEKIALSKVPNGTIKEGELEKEKGKLIWSFDIATPGTQDTTEVNVDAITGGIIAVDVESPAKEKAEAKKEKDDDEKEEKK